MKIIYDDEIDDEQTTTTEGQQLPNYLSITNRFLLSWHETYLKEMIP